MKKLLFKTFLLLSIITLNSCSSNSDNDDLNPTNGNEIKMTVNGNELIFNNIKTEQNLDAGQGKKKIKFTATINGQTDKFLIFSVYEEVTGSDSLISFKYSENGVTYDEPIHPGFDFNVLENISSTLKASFSGSVQETSRGTGTIDITNGIINIKF